MLNTERPRIRRLVPASVRKRLPKTVQVKILGSYGLVRELASDYSDWLIGRRGELVPPRHLFSAAGVGGRVVDFTQGGMEVFRCIIELADLKPTETVLEVGCGIGRNAAPLTKYLDNNGRFEGFDIVPLSIGWCQKKITPRYPNFHFVLADVYNKSYNPKGRFRPSEYKFPYSSESFDFVFLTSVFTHMIPQDVENYLGEIARVLKPMGRCMITFLLLNPESLKSLEHGLSHYDLKYESGPCRFLDREVPEETIAYQEEYVRDLYRRSDLAIVEPIHYGGWSGRKDFYSGQDIIIAKRGP